MFDLDSPSYIQIQEYNKTLKSSKYYKELTIRNTRLDKIHSHLKLKPSLLLHTYELKFNILKKIEKHQDNNSQLQDDDKPEGRFIFKQETILLYTRHQQYIELPNLMKVKFDSQFNLLVQDKMELEELKIKYRIIKDYLRSQR